MVIAIQVEVKPRGSLVQSPVSRRQTMALQLRCLVVGFEPIVDFDSDTGAVLVDFASALLASPAGAVADELGALCFRTQVGHVVQGAIAAFLTVKEY